MQCWTKSSASGAQNESFAGASTMKILLPVDGSKYTRRMLAYIAAHDELLGSGHDYLLFTAVPRLSPRAASFFDRPTLQSYYEDEAQAVLRAPLAFAARRMTPPAKAGRRAARLRRGTRPTRSPASPRARSRA
jgi:hypothetical protein